MSSQYLLVLSVTVGVMVVIQGGINARLGMMLSNTLLATSIALLLSAIITLIAFFITTKEYPTVNQIKNIPIYWYMGGLFSFSGLSLFYYVIPRLGISTVVTFGLTGQIIFASIAAHYGWFGMPIEQISIKKIIGMLIMIMGLTVIKY
ncbi:DMT family transporter [Marivirga arenosa]|uniref:DMT family transporter n=1 Tax=Marivirga arenosa TaxID=3059076 RepID=A0AA49GG62_9BACT|nr:DMT family transporter [Marivirga sp. BKB1-2]WKK81044.2 DMT family transporter [Marivirga sp. BKB1-2]